VAWEQGYSCLVPCNFVPDFDLQLLKKMEELLAGTILHVIYSATVMSHKILDRKPEYEANSTECNNLAIKVVDCFLKKLKFMQDFLEN